MDSRGPALQRMCTATSLQICTGQIAGDEAALPTLAATRRTQPICPDHILANAAARSMLSSVVVSQHRRGSDHWPLEAQLTVDLHCQPLQPGNGQPIPCRRWRSQARSAYCDLLVSQPPPDGAARGDVPHIISQLHSHVTAAAEGAGMPMRQPARQRPGRASPHQPFFDAECRSLKRQVRTADGRGAGHSRDTTIQSSEGRREPTRWPDYSSLWTAVAHSSTASGSSCATTRLSCPWPSRMCSHGTHSSPRWQTPGCRLPSSCQIAPTHSRIQPGQQFSMQTLQWQRWSASCPSYTMAGLQAMHTCLQTSCAMRNSPPSPLSHCPHICWRPLLRSSSRP